MLEKCAQVSKGGVEVMVNVLERRGWFQPGHSSPSMVLGQNIEHMGF